MKSSFRRRILGTCTPSATEGRWKRLTVKKCPAGKPAGHRKLSQDKRLFVAGLYHETNTFVDRPTELEKFQILRGEAILSLRGNDSPMDGLLQTAWEFGWTVVPGVVYQASPSGPVRDDVFETYWGDFLPRLEAALARGN